jgi:hypothetical protein
MIDPVLVIFLTILIFFILFMVFRSMTGWHFCVLCASVSATWILFLVLYWSSLFDHLVLIAVLTGSTVAGIYYLVEQRTHEATHVFRLPFFLTLLFIIYLILGVDVQLPIAAVFLTLLWLAFVSIYLYQQSPKVNKLANHLIECCKNW